MLVARKAAFSQSGHLTGCLRPLCHSTPRKQAASSTRIHKSCKAATVKPHSAAARATLCSAFTQCRSRSRLTYLRRHSKTHKTSGNNHIRPHHRPRNTKRHPASLPGGAFTHCRTSAQSAWHPNSHGLCATWLLSAGPHAGPLSHTSVKPGAACLLTPGSPKHMQGTSKDHGYSAALPSGSAAIEEHHAGATHGGHSSRSAPQPAAAQCCPPGGAHARAQPPRRPRRRGAQYNWP